MAKAKTSDQTTLQIIQVQDGLVEFCILGTTPIILNRVSVKAKHELLLPSGKKTAADKAGSLKHDPYKEFQSAAYLDLNEDAPTLITHLATAFKKGISAAAMDVPGSSKAQIGRLCWVLDERISIFGVPKMLMSVVRSSDVARTPDIRTRVIIPKWAARIKVSFIKPKLDETSVTNLLVSAGMSQGVGDWRVSKGSGTYGSYKIVAEDDAEYQYMLKHGTREVQKLAMETPEPYDLDTEEMYGYFQEEVARRGKEALVAPKPKKTKAAAQEESSAAAV